MKNIINKTQLEHLINSINKTAYGEIIITLHNNKIQFIETREKIKGDDIK